MTAHFPFPSHPHAHAHCNPPLQVLGGGELLEDGAPGELAQRPGGTFASMVKASRAATAATHVGSLDTGAGVQQQ